MPLPHHSFRLQVMRDGTRGGGVLRQRVTVQPGVNSWNGNLLNPVTSIGDANPATNVYDKTSVSVTVMLPTPKQSRDPGRTTSIPDWWTPPPTPPPPTHFEAHPNSRIFGRGYWQISGMFTLPEAEAKCLSQPQCVAITMQSATPPANTTQVEMWLTGSDKYYASTGDLFTVDARTHTRTRTRTY